MMQKTQAAVGTNQAPVIVGTPKAATAPTADEAPAAPEAPEAPRAIPKNGGQIIIDNTGDRTVITSAQLPPEVMPIVRMAKDTALGLMGLLAVIIIFGPFARMMARRMERKPALKAAENHTLALQQQILQLQQSVDAMSVEVERISESQRFQSKLLFEKKSSASLT